MKKQLTPSEVAILRARHWTRTFRDGNLHKKPALSRGAHAVLVAISGMVDNRHPQGPLTGRGKRRLGPTVLSLATVTGIDARWARECVRQLAEPLADADGYYLDPRGATAPASGGSRTPHTRVDMYVPFIRKAPGGHGGGRRNQLWLHPAFYDMPDDKFDALTELPPWPSAAAPIENSSCLNRKSVPIQIEYPDSFE